MPETDGSIEPLINWALQERERVIAQSRKKAEQGGELAEEYRKVLTEHEAVSPEELAADMRKYPQHYMRQMSQVGGNMSPVAVFRKRVELPPTEPRIQVLGMPLGSKKNTGQNTKYTKYRTGELFR